jgi:hypothetical protein
LQADRLSSLPTGHAMARERVHCETCHKLTRLRAKCLPNESLCSRFPAIRNSSCPQCGISRRSAMGCPHFSIRESPQSCSRN